MIVPATGLKWNGKKFSDQHVINKFEAPSKSAFMTEHSCCHAWKVLNKHACGAGFASFLPCMFKQTCSIIMLPVRSIDLVGESTGTVEVKDEGSLKDICTCMWFILKLFQELVPGEVDDNECNFEEQLLEELLQHFETGVGNPTFIDDLHSWKDKLWINVAKADSARSCISACRITSKLQHPTGRAELNVCQKHICLCWLVDKTSNDLPRLVQCFDANCKLAEPSTLVTQPTCFDMSLELVFANFNW